jgi:Rrf2 family protein
MLSQKTRYALKALVLLAERELQAGKKEEPVLISDLAQKGQIPQKFLEAILLELKNHGLLRSKKGKGGGYLLARSAEEIQIGQIVRILEGPLALLPCVSQMSHRKCEGCHDEETCGTRILFKEVRDATAGILDGASLAKVVQVQDKVRQNKQLMYFI